VAWECGNRHYRFPRSVGRVGKTVSSFFPPFPRTGISTPASVVRALRRQLSPARSPIPFRSQPGWHSSASSACVFGYTRAARRWFHPWPDGSFQSADRAAVPPSASRTGVVPAVALAAHRLRDCILFEHLPEVFAGVFHPKDKDLSVGTPVLAAAIAMENQLVASIRTAVEPGHL
jgi:hypothetical protein